MAVFCSEHGLCVVCTTQLYFANKIIADSMRVSSPRLDATHTCRTRVLSFDCFGRTVLDDDRSGGRVCGMEWSGLGWGRGWGWGLGSGRGEGEGEGNGNRPILDCSNMMTVLFVYYAKQACFVKAYYRPFVN